MRRGGPGIACWDRGRAWVGGLVCGVACGDAGDEGGVCVVDIYTHDLQ